MPQWSPMDIGSSRLRNVVCLKHPTDKFAIESEDTAPRVLAAVRGRPLVDAESCVVVDSGRCRPRIVFGGPKDDGSPGRAGPASGATTSTTPTTDGAIA